jgi:HisJ family histidinol phosphate phosphatase
VGGAEAGPQRLQTQAAPFKTKGPQPYLKNILGFVQSERDPRVNAIPDIHGHAKGEHKPYAEERPLPLTARILFLWFYHACRRGHPRFMMVSDHMNYLTFEDPAAVNLVRRALKLAQAGDLYGAAETANVDVVHAQVVSDGLRRGMRYSIGAEVDNDPRSRPDAQNIVDAMRPDGIIRSVHFIPIDHPVHGPNWNWPFDNPEFASLYDHVGTDKTWELYMAVLLDAIERLPGHIVGHFYVPAIFGNWPDDATLEAHENRMLDAVATRGMAVEFNTRFLYRDHTDEEIRRYLAANTRLLRKAKERGIGIAVGSDAHSPKDQGAGFDTVLQILDELEINEIVFPIGGRLLRVALRVVKPPEPEPPPPPPPEPAVKPVRKGRPAPTAVRAKETSPERSESDRKPSASAAHPAPEPEPAPPAAKPALPDKAKAAAKTAEPKKLPPLPKTTEPGKLAVNAAKAPAAKAPPPAKPASKPPPVKAAPAKPAAVKATPKGAASKAKVPAKAKTAPKAIAKAAPARKPVKKAAAPAKKSPPAKKAAPAKKAPAKKVSAKAPARLVKKAPVKKPPPKKPAAKKSAAKRR